MYSDKEYLQSIGGARVESSYTKTINVAANTKQTFSINLGQFLELSNVEASAGTVEDIRVQNISIGTTIPDYSVDKKYSVARPVGRSFEVDVTQGDTGGDITVTITGLLHI